VNGPDHYRTAETVMAQAQERFDVEPEEARDDLRFAQIHATLALAAATALGNANPDNDPDAEWWDATHESPGGGVR
jgi:hypothetical protein